ncbi:ABC transporter permease [Saccharibacillus endophyticus]|uniref:ABC transporter permease n=1 Tax=Saccharibacillus endophyticus TaxID=2060666 RepID=A0ABQ1ZPE0_9BACL|nr:ABC transporter permease subunit [Saccharibacillus endophyticus]GGH73010.1 ABC transporter permease [Saccharibacillus endophyticus]
MAKSALTSPDQPTNDKPSIGQRVKSFAIDYFRQWQLQTMVIPGILFMIVFCFVPIYGLTIAFKSYTVIDTLDSAPWVGLENFRIILSDRYFWDSVVNTLAISFLKLGIGFILPIVLAIMIYEVRYNRFKKFVQTVSYLPHFLSWIVLGGMMITWFSTTGLFNQLLLDLGLISNAQNILLDANKYWWIATLSDIWKESGWGTILYLAIMAKIDPTYYEAAKIDGAGRLRQIWNITLPNMKMIISLNLILTISGLLGSNLDQTLVLMNSQNREKAEVINSYVYRMGLAQGDFSYATAVGLGVSIVSVILLLTANKVTSKMNDNQSVL